MIDYKGINRCKNCILPESFPSIYFIDGLCSFCIDFKNEKNELKLRDRKDLEMQLTSKGNSKYDCLVPLSGGKDSSFIMFYLVDELKLNPLAILVDTGNQTDLAINNVKRICSFLKTDLIIAHPTNYRRLATFEALKVSLHLKRFWTVGICSYCENLLRSTVIKEARKRSINKVVWGSTDFEDTVKSYHKGWNSATFRSRYGSRKNIKEILMNLLTYVRNFAEAPISLFYVLKFWVYTILMKFDLGKRGTNMINPFSEFSFKQKGVEVIYFFDFIKYDPIRQIETLKKNLNWQSQTNREIRFDCSLSCFRNYEFMKQTGISKTGFQLSTLIRHGLISRHEVLEKEINIEKDLRTICYETFAKLKADHN